MERRSNIRVVAVLFCVSAFAGLSWWVASQQRTISRLRSQAQTLQQATNELGPLRAEVQATRHLRDQAAEIEQLREQNQDVLRLRNEVTRLQGQKSEAESLRKANTQLLQLVESMRMSSNQQQRLLALRSQGAALGIYARPMGVSPAQTGVLVQGIDPHSPVAQSGLKVGDTIVRVNGRPVETLAQLQVDMLTRTPGETVLLDVVRNGAVFRIPVQTRPLP